VVDGKNPRAVVTEIAESLEVSRSKARQFAQTDITDTLRQAKIAEDQAAEDDLGIKTGLLWTSAFKPTTRPWHASRSGKVYSRDEVQAFYERDGNRYNCFCAVTTCLLDAAGKPILTDGLRSKMRAEREAWQREHPAS
jgi:SPP1 gp7 family putative phage head morphogenesis protein